MTLFKRLLLLAKNVLLIVNYEMVWI